VRLSIPFSLVLLLAGCVPRSATQTAPAEPLTTTTTPVTAAESTATVDPNTATLSPTLAPFTPTPLLPGMTLELVGQVGGESDALAIQGAYAYLGVGLRLAVVEITELSNPQIVGQSEILGGLVQSVALAGDYAYVATGDGGVQVIDVADPTGPRRVGTLDLDGAANDVAVVGNYAYVATGDSCMLGANASSICTGNLRVVDISSPARPREVGRADTEGWPYSLAITGKFAYLVASDGTNLVGGLRVIEVSQPETPRLAGSLDTEDANGVALDVARNYAYIAGDSLWVIDISNPNTPHKISSLGAFMSSVDIAVAGNYAYVVNESCEFGKCFSSLQAVDVTDPATPHQAQSQSSQAGASGMGVGRGIVLLDGLAYLVQDKGLEIRDVSKPGDWERIGYLEAVGPVSKLVVADDHVYAAAGQPGQESLHIIDVQDPTQPINMGHCEECAGLVNGMAVGDGYAYLGVWEGGLRILDIRDLAHPRLVGHLAIGEPGGAGIFDLALGKGFVIITMEIHSLRVVEVIDPAQPREVSSLSLPVLSYAPIALAGEYAHVLTALCGEAGCEERLQLIDLSDPTKPRLMGNLEVLDARVLAVADNYAYVASELCDDTYSSCSQELWLIDVTDPKLPRLVSKLTLAKGARDIRDLAVSEGYAYLLGSSGLRVIDVTDPTQPREIGASDVRGPNLDVVGGYVYVAGESNGLLILQVSPLASGKLLEPVVIKHLATLIRMGFVVTTSVVRND